MNPYGITVGYLSVIADGGRPLLVGLVSNEFAGDVTVWDRRLVASTAGIPWIPCPTACRQARWT
ncbi:hypothetical protein [Actinomadura sp. HBU206391]|uniref:hypothetical protein n=1 Tax=Actinomadura sp. HBU206391 TaxID=2731692 RepID=UPI00164FCCC4|nr:hypothetical protein [Actinomadura sp. HBU206391]MBC6460757.1 hypothetical protein [Actinomadura sp. HBU206391]